MRFLILNEVLAHDLIENFNFGTISLRFSMRKKTFFRKGYVHALNCSDGFGNNSFIIVQSSVDSAIP